MTNNPPPERVEIFQYAEGASGERRHVGHIMAPTAMMVIGKTSAIDEESATVLVGGVQRCVQINGRWRCTAPVHPEGPSDAGVGLYGVVLAAFDQIPEGMVEREMGITADEVVEPAEVSS